MINIIMFGTGSTSEYIYYALKKEVNIVAYLDNNSEKWSQYKHQIYIDNPENINKYKFDYVVIASQFNDEINEQLLELGVKQEKIFQYFIFRDKLDNYFEDNINKFLKSHVNSCELLVTGISYAMTGFDVENCAKHAYNLAVGHQDLFYDYKVIEYILSNNKKKLEKLKYVVIGLSYYSFQYDMSLSSMKNKIIYYYELLKDSHNFKEINKIYDLYAKNQFIAKRILKTSDDGKFDFIKGYIPFFETSDKDIIGKRQAKIDCNKNYPKTVIENKQIFLNYLRLVRENNIKPIVIVFPTTKYYNMHFSKRIENEFKEIIKECRKTEKFQFLDCFRLNIFNDQDFQDVSHLNYNGAKKFTEYLNDRIQW